MLSFSLLKTNTIFFINSKAGCVATVGNANGFPDNGGVPVANGEIFPIKGVIVVGKESLMVVKPPAWITPFISGTPVH